jgi:Pentapeptide repeats (8 copies)
MSGGSTVEEIDAGVPMPVRAAELRAACVANRAARQPPYAGVALRTLDELRWVLREHGWSGAFTRGHHPPDLRQANLSGADLVGVDLRGADLSGAVLAGTNLCGAHLEGADLRHAIMDRTTRLPHAHLQGAALGQAQLDAVDLTTVAWGEVSWLGDERLARTARSLARKATAYRSAEQVYRTLSSRLRSQGLSADAARFRSRADTMALRRRRYEGLGRLNVVRHRAHTVMARWLRLLETGSEYMGGLCVRVVRLTIVCLLLAASRRK